MIRALVAHGRAVIAGGGPRAGGEPSAVGGEEECVMRR